MPWTISAISPSTSHRAVTHEALAIGVIGDQALIPFKLGPANVAFVTVDDQSLPLATLLAAGRSNRVWGSFRDGARTSSPMSHSKQRRIIVTPVRHSGFCPADFAAPDAIRGKAWMFRNCDI